MRVHRPTRALMGAAVGGLVVAALVAVPGATPYRPSASPAPAAGDGSAAAKRRRADHPSSGQLLYRIAKDTWAFYDEDVDPTTHLPLDNLGPGDARGTYTSAANIGVYLWSVVAAGDLHLISRPQEVALVKATLTDGAVTLPAPTASSTSGTTRRPASRSEPGRHRLLGRDDAGAGQLLVPVGRRQRVVRVRARGGPAGAAGAARTRPTAC